MSRYFASAISAAATARICGTPPAELSTCPVVIVCTESTTSSPGSTSSTWVSSGGQVVLGGEVELVVHAAGALGAQPHLGGRLLAGDDQRPAAACCGVALGDLEQQR